MSECREENRFRGGNWSFSLEGGKNRRQTRWGFLARQPLSPWYREWDGTGHVSCSREKPPRPLQAILQPAQHARLGAGSTCTHHTVSGMHASRYLLGSWGTEHWQKGTWWLCPRLSFSRCSLIAAGPRGKRGHWTAWRSYLHCPHTRCVHLSDPSALKNCQLHREERINRFRKTQDRARDRGGRTRSVRKHKTDSWFETGDVQEAVRGEASVCSGSFPLHLHWWLHLSSWTDRTVSTAQTVESRDTAPPAPTVYLVNTTTIPQNQGLSYSMLPKRILTHGHHLVTLCRLRPRHLPPSSEGTLCTMLRCVTYMSEVPPLTFYSVCRL